jgi:hypothetical protein
MRNTALLQRGVVALLISALLVSAGASTALADTPSETGPTNALDQASESDITINGLDIALKDVQITGNGLPEMSIEDRTYSVDERTITLDGMTVTINDTEIGVNDLTITVENSTLAIQNVGISSE